MADQGSAMIVTDPNIERTGISRSDRRGDSTRNDTVDLGIGVAVTDPTNERTKGRSDSRRRNDTTDQESGMAVTDPTNERSGMSRSETRRNDTTDEGNSRCVRVTVLLLQGCIQSCLVEDSDGCPACNLTCLGR